MAETAEQSNMAVKDKSATMPQFIPGLLLFCCPEVMVNCFSRPHRPPGYSFAGKKSRRRDGLCGGGKRGLN
jgi:hypothetical protein